jgi:hypothetical protein
MHPNLEQCLSIRSQEPCYQTKNGNSSYLNTAYNAHTESLFKTAAILPLPLLIDYFRIQFMQQFVFNHLSSSFADCWTSNAARREEGPALRNEDDFFVPLSRLSSTDRHPLIIFPKTWNELSAPELKSTSHKNTFNKLL